MHLPEVPDGSPVEVGVTVDVVKVSTIVEMNVVVGLGPVDIVVVVVIDVASV